MAFQGVGSIAESSVRQLFPTFKIGSYLSGISGKFPRAFIRKEWPNTSAD